MNDKFINNKFEQHLITYPGTGLSVKQKYWGIHEAAFEFTGWPKEGLFEFSGFEIKEDIKKDRSFFYMPISGEIDFKLYGKEFKKNFLSIKHAIENFHLKGRFQPLCCGSNYVVSPWDVIVHVLRNQCKIREGFQAILGIHQDTHKPKKALREKIKNLTRAQYYFVNQAYQYVDPICKKIKGAKKDTTAIRNQINEELFDAKGKSGRPTNNKKSNRKYIHKALPEVRAKDGTGKSKYHFSLLEDVITTIVFEKIKVIGIEPLQKISLDKLLDEFGIDATVQLYLKDAPEVIFHFVHQIAEDIFSDYQNSNTVLTLTQQLKLSPLAKGING